MLSDRVLVSLIAALTFIIVVLAAAVTYLAITGKPGGPEVGAALTLAVGTFMSGQLFFGHVAAVSRMQAANNSLAQTVMSAGNDGGSNGIGSNANADALKETGQNGPTTTPTPSG